LKSFSIEKLYAKKDMAEKILINYNVFTVFLWLTKTKNMKKIEEENEWRGKKL